MFSGVFIVKFEHIAQIVLDFEQANTNCEKLMPYQTFQ